MVFNESVMRSRLPRDIYKALKKTMSQGTHLEPPSITGISGFAV